MGRAAKNLHLGARQGEIAERVVICGDPERADHVSLMLEERRLISTKRGFVIYSGTWRGCAVSVVSHGIGGPSAAIVVEELGILGARCIVRLGTAGALVAGMPRGSLIVPTAAAMVGGYMKSYLGDSYIPPIPDPVLSDLILRSCLEAGLRPIRGVVVSSDAFYAERGEFVERWRRAGVVAVEMECAVLFLLGALRGLKTAALLIVGNNIVDDPHGGVASAEELRPFVESAARPLLDALASYRWE